MSADLMEYYENRLSHNPSDKYVNISCEVDYPAISYNVHSYGDDRERNVQSRQLEKAGGVDAFFEFKTVGVVKYPREFEQAKCDFLLNPLGSLDRFSHLEKGSIGEGWFQNDTFLFRLYLSLDVARGLIEQMKSNSENSPTTFSIRFDLFDLARQRDWISYTICRVYCFPGQI